MRKLLTAALSFSAAVYICHYLMPRKLWLIAALLCIALSALAFLFKGDTRLRIFCLCLAFSAGVGVYAIHYGAKVLPARVFTDIDMEISAVVTDYPTVLEGSYASLPIKLQGQDTPRLKALLYSYGAELNELEPGDKIKAYVRIKPSDSRYGEDYDKFRAENIYFLCYMKGDIELTGKSSFSFMYFPKTIAKTINETAKKVFSSTAAPFMSALLTGEKAALYKDTQLYTDMSKTGVLHIVAVSGMHVAFFVGFIRLFVRRKKTACLITIPLLWIFVPVAGATASVIRAAFMHSLVLIAPLLKRENDAMTSLFTILALLLLINPLACASVGLQLSFTAMLGMLIVAPAIYKAITKWAFDSGKSKKKAGLPQRAYKKAALAVFAAFSSTLGALSFSTPIAALYFGYFSLIGILVNVLIFALVSASFILGYLSCITGVIWLSLGETLGAVTSFFAELMIKIIGLGAKAPYGALYTEGSAFGLWLILVYTIIILCYIFKPKKGFRPYIPLSLAVISLCALIIIYELRLEVSPDTVRIIDVGQGQSLILTSGRHTAVIDCGGKGKLGNAGDTVAARLLREGRRSIDFLALTHFDDDHVNGVIRLMCQIEVERIIIPPDDFDRAACIEILEFAALKDVPVYVINEDSDVKAGDMELSVFAPENDKEKALMFLGKLKDFELMVTGDAYAADERRLIKRQELPDVDLIIAGHHGSKHSSSNELLRVLRAEYAAISSGYNNYGHPGPETLERFAKAGIKVYRTDLQGDIIFYIN